MAPATLQSRGQIDQVHGPGDYWRDAEMLPTSLQIGTLKELHLCSDLSDSLFSYGFGSISAIGKNFVDIAGLGGQTSPPSPGKAPDSN